MASEYSTVEGPENCPGNEYASRSKRSRIEEENNVEQESSVQYQQEQLGASGSQGDNGNIPTVVLSSVMSDAAGGDQSEYLLPTLHPYIGNDPDMLQRIRHPSFQAGLQLMVEGSKHMVDCPAADAGNYNHTRDCTCIKRTPRPGRRRSTIVVSEGDLMCYPLKQFNAFIQDSGLADSQFVEYTRFLREMWHKPNFTKERLPESCCELGCGRLKEFRQLLQSACLTPNGTRFLEEERERFMNRRQQHNSRLRRKDKTRDSGDSPTMPDQSMPIMSNTPSRGEPSRMQFNAPQQYPGAFPTYVVPQLGTGMGSPSDAMRGSSAMQQRMSSHFSYPTTWHQQQGLMMGQQQGPVPMVMNAQQGQYVLNPMLVGPGGALGETAEMDAARHLTSLNTMNMSHLSAHVAHAHAHHTTHHAKNISQWAKHVHPASPGLGAYGPEPQQTDSHESLGEQDDGGARDDE